MKETIKNNRIMDTIYSRAGSSVSPQVGMMGEITFDDGNFLLPDGQVFNIKNNGDDDVEIEVRLDQMPEGTFITTKFAPGWNPEVVREVKASNVENLKYGC